LGGVNVQFQDAPLKRVAILSGTNDPAIRASALEVVKNISGVMDARWADDKVSPEDTAKISADVAAVNAADAAKSEAGAAAAKAADAKAKLAAATPVAVAPATAGAATSTPSAGTPATRCQAKVNAAIGNRSISFVSGSPWVNFPARDLIADVAKALNACPSASVAISGHADGSGAPSVNLSLSQERASAVKAIMVEKGVAATRITAKGYGSTAQGGAGGTRSINFTVNGG
jgi:outer membrane protein OmpA-like peptidoglycan-associated protein